MKKQDNESLIQEIQKRLDWYTMEASDEEFDADEENSETLISNSNVMSDHVFSGRTGVCCHYF